MKISRVILINKGFSITINEVQIVSEIKFSETEAQTFLRIIRDMPANLVYGIIHHYDIDIPIEFGLAELPAFLFDELEPEARKKIMDDYADAGKALCYFFSFDKETPEIPELMKKSKSIISLKKEGFFENVPYFDKYEIHDSTGTFRARFHYYRGRNYLFDKSTQTMKEYLPVYQGVVILKPKKKLVEVRAIHRPVSRNAATSSSVALGMEAPFTLNLHKEEYVQRFLNWINSLNNARFEFDVSRVLSSLSMSARGKIDLRRTDEFKKYLQEGRLKGGHVTIITEEKRPIRFRIFFRNCRVYFTSFGNENDITIVGEALEKIMEGYEFEIPKKLLTDYFK